MISFRTARLRAARALRADTGISIIEVLVAVVIFSMISVGVAQAMVNAIRLSSDGQHRTVALNLAATELDRLKALNNPYSIASTSTPIVTPVDGVNYSLSRKVSWVNVNGNEISCAAASGTFQLLRVKVSVDWAGRMSGSSPASTSTTISPQNTILSPTTATLFISVNRADGTPYVGAQPTVISPTGASLSVPATNADGCSYLAGIGAGTYTVSVTASGGISDNETTVGTPNTTPTVVTPGSAVSVGFNYDAPATLSPLSYGSAGWILPSNLTSTYSASSIPKPYYVSNTPTSLALYPVSSGYSVVAGNLIQATTGATPYAGCLSPDPVNWTAATVGATPLKAGIDPANATATPGGTAAFNVGMGSIKVTTAAPGIVKLTSAAAPLVPGDPGCANISGAAAQTYYYTISGPGTWTLGVPYGAWSSAYSLFGIGAYNPISATPNNSYASPGAPSFTVDPRTP